MRARTGWCLNSKLTRWTTLARSASREQRLGLAPVHGEGLVAQDVVPVGHRQAHIGGVDERRRVHRDEVEVGAPAHALDRRHVARAHHVDDLAPLERGEHGGDHVCPEPGADHPDPHVPVF